MYHWNRHNIFTYLLHSFSVLLLVLLHNFLFAQQIKSLGSVASPFSALGTLTSTTGFHQHQTFPTFDFIENKGQWSDDILFRANTGDGYVNLTKTGVIIQQFHPEDMAKLAQRAHAEGVQSGNGGVTRPPIVNEKNPLSNGGFPIPSGGTGGVTNVVLTNSTQSYTVRAHTYQVIFTDQPIELDRIKGEKPTGGTHNFFLGADSTKWGRGSIAYSNVRVKNMYPGIDVLFYSEGGHIKYDFILQPGANPNNIVLRYEGAEKLQIKNNELLIKTSVGEMRELYPYSYQSGPTGRREVLCKYVLDKNQVRFKLSDYNKNEPLVIDPTLIFSTFSGARSDNWGFTATYGIDGSFYGGGIIFAGNFPTSPGAYQVTYGGGSDAFDIVIIRLLPNGRAPQIYSTYLGGIGSDQPHSLVADAAGNLYIAGRTNNAGSYPQTGARFGSGGNWDIVVSKLSADGRQLLGSRIIGGTEADGVNISTSRVSNSLHRNYGDDARSEIILDSQDNVWIAASSQSDNFPVTPGSFQTTKSGLQDAVVIKMNNNLNAILNATYLGGTQNDAGFVLAQNPVTGNMFVAGATASSGLAGANSTAPFSNFNGGVADGFVAEFNSNLTSLVRLSYHGTNGVDLIYGIQFDRNGFPYIMGTTTGSWPVQNAAYSNPGSKQFITKLTPTLNGIVFSTVFGASSTIPNISPTAFLVDRCENLYVSGWGGQTGNGYANILAGTSGMPVTADAFMSTTDNQDFYFIVLGRNASNLLYGSFFGRQGGFSEHVDGGTSRFDPNGGIYQAICAACARGDGLPTSATYPVTAGSFAPVKSGDYCNLGMVRFNFEYAGVVSTPQAFINNRRDSIGCNPAQFEFRDSLQTGRKYIWNFGDGSPDVETTDFSVFYTYTLDGNFRVRLIVEDSSQCNIRDTAFINVTVRSNRVNLDFNFEKLDPCEALNYRFDNLSSLPPGFSFDNDSFVWDFGDNTPRITTGPASVTHSYVSPGTYNVKLFLVDTSFCNVGDSIERQIRIAANVDARFETPAVGCAPYDAFFNNTSLAGTEFFWDFGDGNTSNEESPTHRYDNPGTYTVRLIAVDLNTCNQRDTTFFTINVFNKPTANFTFSPVVPIENTPTEFFNSSSADAIRFKWDFGDGDTLITQRRDTTVRHQYTATGTFNACLIAYNAAGCTDTICAPIETLVRPLVDVPNAFVPNGVAPNNVIKPAGFGIAQMRFRIYNRWGQLMFESNSLKFGWDGRFNGVLQPMDVYAYTLEVTFFNGERTIKKGDITLIR